jgi:hypothetical protein
MSEQSKTLSERLAAAQDIGEILSEVLAELGYGGVYSDCGACACSMDDFAQCGAPDLSCVPGCMDSWAKPRGDETDVFAIVHCPKCAEEQGEDYAGVGGSTSVLRAVIVFVHCRCKHGMRAVEVDVQKALDEGRNRPF